MPWWASIWVMVATTPVVTGVRSLLAHVTGTIPSTSIPANTARCTICRLIGLSFWSNARGGAEAHCPLWDRVRYQYHRHYTGPGTLGSWALMPFTSSVTGLYG